jgi:cobalt-precorrin-7 (C5)-methyltransferase
MSDAYDLDSGPDPAAFAAAAPEPDLDTDFGVDGPVVRAVGIGPGNPEYLTPRGKRAIEEAEVLVGFETVIDLVGRTAERSGTDLLACGYRDESETLEIFAERVASGARGTAVLMGDPNFSGYQFLGKIQQAIGAPVRVVPGISSLQIAASRARTPMEDSSFITLHKSGAIEPDLDRLCRTVGERHLLVLPRPYDWMPGDIAAALSEAGASASLEALVFERLTHEDEAVTRTTLGELASHAGGTGRDSTPFSDLSVLVVRSE